MRHGIDRVFVMEFGFFHAILLGANAFGGQQP